MPSGEVITAPADPTATYLSEPQHTSFQPLLSEALVLDVHDPYEADVAVVAMTVPLFERARASPVIFPVMLRPVGSIVARVVPFVRSDITPLPASYKDVSPMNTEFFATRFESVGPLLKTSAPDPVLVVVPVPPLTTEIVPIILAIFSDDNPYPFPA
jgi:hypothetical protein